MKNKAFKSIIFVRDYRSIEYILTGKKAAVPSLLITINYYGP